MQKKGNWVVKSRNIIHKDAWMEIIRDQVLRPNGEEGDYTTVKIIPGISVLPVDRNRQVYLLKNYLYAIDRTVITVPGGAIDEGESLEEAVRRELKEETGLATGELIPMGSVVEVTSSIVDSSNRMFLAIDLEEGEQELEDSENIQVFKISLDEAVKMVMTDQIVHPLTALLIMKVKHYYDYPSI